MRRPLQFPELRPIQFFCSNQAMSLGQGLASKYYSGFNPLTIGGCVLWLDAADSTKYTMSGANLATWNDKSSNNYVCTPVSGNNITQSTLNGLNVFNFNNLRALISNFVWSYDSTIFLVTRSANSAFLYSHWTTTYTNYVFPNNNALFYVASSAQYRDTVDTGGARVQIADAWGIFAIGYDSITKVPTNFAVNGLTRSAVLETGTPPGAGSVTATLYLNGNGSTNATSNSFVAEILHFNRSISAAERQQIEGYLAQKWGLKSLLPQLSYSSSLPLSIPGCALWLDAADSTTITLSGSSVTQWNDKSGSNQHAIQAVVAKRPVYSNASVNGLATVQTSAAAASGMYIPNFTVTYPLTTFVVSQKWGTGGFNAMFIEQSADLNGASAGFYIYSANGDFYYVKRAGSGISVFGSNWTFNAVGTTYIYLAQISPNLIRVNGNILRTGNTLNSGSPSGSVTDQLNIGSRGQTTTLVGDVRYCEIIVYSGNLTADQYYRIERYLALKWGAATSTPHPYASIIPVTRSFQPIDIAGCSLWLDAADPSTLTLSGSNVSQWNDKSGNGSHVSQATSANQPTYTSNGVLFDGVNDFLRSSVAISSFITASDYTVFLYGINFSVTAGGPSYTGPMFISDENGWFGIFISSTQVGAYNWDGNADYAGVSYTTSNNAIVTTQHTGGVLSASLFGNTAGTVASGNTGNLTFQLNLGRSYAGSFHTNCRINELIIFNRALTVSERQQVEGYLAWKWGLQGPTFPLIVGTFNPTQISGCQLWLDGNDPAGTGVQPANGASISTWVDKSGNGRNGVNQATAATFGSNFQNSQGVLQFVGTQNYLVTYPSFPNTAYTIFSVQRVTDGTTYRRVLHGGTNFALFLGVSNSNVATFTGNSTSAWNDVAANSPATTNLNTWRVVTMQVSGSSLIPFVDGTQQTSKTGTTGAFSNLNVGAASDNGQAWIGQIAEIVIYSSALSSSSRQQIETYLGNKWGISTSPITTLPTSHPFRNVIPATTSFNPRQISNCALWLDAADPSTLTLSGSNVTTWADKSGNGRNASGGVSPTYASNAVVFNGSSYLTTTAPAGSNTASYFVVFNATTPTVAGVLIGGNVLSTAVLVVNTNLILGDWNANVATNSTTILAGQTYLGSGLASSGTLSVGLNGGTLSSGSATFSGSGTFTVGAGFTDNRNKFNGSIYEIIVFSSTLSTNDRQRVEGYLAWKWGLQASLTPTLTTFSPSQFSGLSFWLDATDSTTFTFSSGSNISQWRDKSSSAFAGTAVSSPVRVQSGINGYPSVNFNGSTQYVDFGNVVNMGTSSIYIFVVCQFSTSANSGVVGKSSARTNAGRWSMIRDAGSGGMALLIDAAGLGIVAAYADTSTSARILSGYWDRSRIYNVENGALRASTALSSTANLSNTDPLYVGAYQNGTGTGPLAGYFFNGNIGEILVYTTSLTETQRRQVENYLAAKWGIPVSGLPATHPYRKISPI
jgi:hypothetical protein